MPNINAFRSVVHEIFEDLLTFSLFCPLLGQPLYLNRSESPTPNHVSHQLWLKLAKWFVRRSRLKEKVNRRTDEQMDGWRTNCNGNSSLEL